MKPDYSQLIKMRQMYVTVCQKFGKNPNEADQYFTKRSQELGWIEKTDIKV